MEERLNTYYILLHVIKEAAETHHFVVGFERIVSAVIYNLRQETRTGICGAAATTTKAVRKEEAKTGEY